MEDVKLMTMDVASYIHVLKYTSDIQSSSDGDSSTFSQEDKENELMDTRVVKLSENVIKTQSMLNVISAKAQSEAMKLLDDTVTELERIIEQR